MYFLHGGAGVNNYGDEIVARQWIDFLANSNAGEVTLSGQRIVSLRSTFGSSYGDINLTDALSKVQSVLPNSFEDSFNAGVSFFDDCNYAKYNLTHKDIREFSKISVFHLHGGGYINNIWKSHAFYMGFGVAMKAKFGCRVIATGLSLNPLPNLNDHFCATMSEQLLNYDLIELRDSESFIWLRKLSPSSKVFLGLDDMFIMPHAHHNSGRNFHICLHGRDWADPALDFINLDIISEYERVIFWECNTLDADRFRELRKFVPRLEKISMKDLIFGRDLVGSDDYMFTTRMHPHIKALRAGATGSYYAPFKYLDIEHNMCVKLGSSFSEAGRPSGFNSGYAQFADDSRVDFKRKLWRFGVTGSW